LEQFLSDQLGISIYAILQKGINKRLEAFASEAPDLLPLTFVWIPEFKENFLMFNFEKLKEQYELTGKWAKSHDPAGY